MVCIGNLFWWLGRCLLGAGTVFTYRNGNTTPNQPPPHTRDPALSGSEGSESKG